MELIECDIEKVREEVREICNSQESVSKAIEILRERFYVNSEHVVTMEILKVLIADDTFNTCITHDINVVEYVEWLVRTSCRCSTIITNSVTYIIYHVVDIKDNFPTMPDFVLNRFREANRAAKEQIIKHIDEMSAE